MKTKEEKDTEKYEVSKYFIYLFIGHFNTFKNRIKRRKEESIQKKRKELENNIIKKTFFLHSAYHHSICTAHFVLGSKKGYHQRNDHWLLQDYDDPR
jgi:hypothetical protein